MSKDLEESLDIIAKSLLSDMSRRFDDMAMSQMTGTTNTSALDATLNASDMLANFERAVAEVRKRAVVFLANIEHDGPILKFETPEDGTRFLMSFDHLRDIHKDWPVKLSRAISERCAEYVPVTYGEMVPRYLQAPPYYIDLNNTVDGA